MSAPPAAIQFENARQNREHEGVGDTDNLQPNAYDETESHGHRELPAQVAADDPRQATFLTDELVPRLESELSLIGTPDGRCLMGASFGAVASLAAAHRAPQTYGRLLLQSGSFAGAGVGCRRRGEGDGPAGAGAAAEWRAGPSRGQQLRGA